MKKVLVLFAILIGLTGCGNPKAELEDAVKKMEELDNFQMQADVNIKVGGEGVNVNMKMNLNADIDFKNEVTKMAMSGNILGEEMTTEMYTKTSTDKTIIYTKADDNWYYTESEIDENNVSDLAVINEAKEVKRVDYEGDGKKYQVTLTQETLKKLFTAIGEIDEEIEEIPLEQLDVFVYIDKGYITKLEMNTPITIEESGVSVTMNVSVNVTISKFNELDNVTIPQDVIDSAVNPEDATKEMEVTMYAYQYLMAAIENTNNGNTIFTDTTLEYDGPQPTSVNLKMEDYDITEGTMVIDGYLITVKDNDIESVKKAD